MQIKLRPPIDDFSWSKNVSQLFGVNRAYYKPKYNIPGHNAIDFVAGDSKLGYGTPIKAMHNGHISKIVQDVPHKTCGNGVYVMDESGNFSTNYWHLSGFECHIGQKVTIGQTIGLMGNSGDCYPKPTQVLPWLGTHCHAGLLIHSKYNRYNGFVDPLPYLIRGIEKLPMNFTRNLCLGSRGDQVAHLQSILRLEDFAKDYVPIGVFGPKTHRDVVKLQDKYGIVPALGFFWPKTRELVNKRWSLDY